MKLINLPLADQGQLAVNPDHVVSVSEKRATGQSIVCLLNQATGWVVNLRYEDTVRRFNEAGRD